MSRQIDETQPLSDEDREYLHLNGQENRVRLLDSAHGVAYAPPVGLTGKEPGLAAGVVAGADVVPGLTPSMVANVGSANPHVALLNASTEALQAELERRRGASASGANEPESDADYEGELVDESDGRPYEKWTVEQLKDQLGYRELNKSGSKAELIERLRDDDS